MKRRGRTKLAADTALLVAAPRCLNKGGLAAVDPDNAGLETLDELLAGRLVLGHDGSRQAELGVVGKAESLVSVLEGDGGQDGAEDLLLPDGHLCRNWSATAETTKQINGNTRLHVDEDGSRDEVTVRLLRNATNESLGA